MSNELCVCLSEGEILDRYSILEIKLNELSDNRRLYIVNELKDYERFNNIINKFLIYYKLLYYINKKIWDLQVTVKKIDKLNKNYASVCYDIHEYNQSRFRLKNIINNIANSRFKEQKSYSICENTVKISSDNLSQINSIIYGIVLYDKINIQFDKNISDKLKNRIMYLFPTLQVVEDSDKYIEINMENENNTVLYKFIEDELSVLLNDKI